jgi:hypothetical protein
MDERGSMFAQTSSVSPGPAVPQQTPDAAGGRRPRRRPMVRLLDRSRCTDGCAQSDIRQDKLARRRTDRAPAGERGGDDTFTKPSVPYKQLRGDPLSCEGDGMHDDPNRTEDLQRRTARRLQSVAVIAPGLIAARLPAAGCGSGTSSSPGVATAGSSSTAAKSSSALSRRAGALAYSQCMRSHGINDFPDPNRNGQIGISAGPGSDLGPGNPQFNAAQQACKSLAPGPGTPAQQHRQLAAALKLSRWMRSDGISDFPDPTTSPGGGVGISLNGSPGSDLNPSNLRFTAADQAFRSLAPGGGGVGQKGPGS